VAGNGTGGDRRGSRHLRASGRGQVRVHRTRVLGAFCGALLQGEEVRVWGIRV